MRNKKFPPIVAVFAAAVAVFSAANFARAADNDLIITEVMYDPNSAKGKCNGTEWVELYNRGEEEIKIKAGAGKDTWRFIDRMSPQVSKKTFSKNIEADGVSQTIEYYNIEPNAFLIISPDLKVFRENCDTFSGNTAKVSLSLLDADSTLALSNNEGATIFSDVTYSVLPGANNNGKTLERIDFNKNDWRESCDIGGTPGEEPEECEAEPDNGTTDPDPQSINTTSPTDTNPPNAPKTYSKNLKITELLPNPSSDEDTGEFTEIYNADPKEIIELSGWKLEDKTGNSYPLPNVSIEPGKYRAFYRNSSKFSLNNTGSEEIFLKNPDGEVVDQVSYSGTVKEDYSYALGGEVFSWTSAPTPGDKNIFDAPIVEASIEASTEYSSDSDGSAATDGNVFLNEIMPNPKDGSDGEYIEIVNGENEPVDLFGWRTKDASKSKGYQFKEHIILDPGEYLAIYRPDSKIALNNSDESVYLYDPKNEIASSVSFAKSIKNSSYSFDGEVWKWSKYSTPGKKNKFDSEPSVKITKPKNAYKDLYTEFSAKAKDKETKKLKYAWDFGDGKKSYLSKTSHKYLATGKYTVTLSVSDDSQTIEKSFSLKVKKYPRPDLEIVKIIPNPAGNDSEREIVEVKNNSGKKIDLAGWKIATGSGEKMYNHPIIGEISLGSNETKTITREISKFSLNNKTGKVQLVMPDDKVIDEVEYSKEKIAEDEACVKIDGEWQWIEPGTKGENSSSSDEDASEDTAESEGENSGEVLGAADENIFVSPGYDSRFTSEDAYIFLSQINFAKSSAEETSCCSMINPSSNIAYLIASLI